MSETVDTLSSRLMGLSDKYPCNYWDHSAIARELMTIHCACVLLACEKLDIIAQLLDDQQ
jgi:hypothetical protein